MLTKALAIRRAGMKLSKIGALCKGAKRIIVYNVFGGQWLSDGYVLYPLVDLPHLDEESVYTIFDIPKDKRSKVQYEERTSLPYGINVADAVTGETPLQYAGCGISYHGAAYTPMNGKDGILFIDRRYLAPFSTDVTLYERYYPGSERAYVAVKRGFLLEGIILPSEVATKELAQALVKIGRLTALAAGEEDDAEQEEIGI